MKRILLPFLLTFIFSGELEVDGNLKVSGNIDAQNQAIKNVGLPQELTDAINGNVLQDALRDDGNYEYQFIFLMMTISGSQIHNTAGWFRIEEMDYEVPLNSISEFPDEISTLLNDGWILDSINGDSLSWWIFKRPIDE